MVEYTPTTNTTYKALIDAMFPLLNAAANADIDAIRRSRIIIVATDTNYHTIYFFEQAQINLNYAYSRITMGKGDKYCYVDTYYFAANNGGGRYCCNLHPTNQYVPYDANTSTIVANSMTYYIVC